jgi:hypothetical protein
MTSSRIPSARLRPKRPSIGSSLECLSYPLTFSTHVSAKVAKTSPAFALLRFGAAGAAFARLRTFGDSARQVATDLLVIAMEN